jgi:hypothetical protein
MDKKREKADEHLSEEYVRFEESVRAILTVPKAKVDEKMDGMKRGRKKGEKGRALKKK